VELPQELHLKRSFFPGFPDGGLFQGLAVINKSTRESPAVWRILPFDKNYAGPAVG